MDTDHFVLFWDVAFHPINMIYKRPLKMFHSQKGKVYTNKNFRRYYRGNLIKNLSETSFFSQKEK